MKPRKTPPRAEKIRGGEDQIKRASAPMVNNRGKIRKTLENLLTGRTNYRDQRILDGLTQRRIKALSIKRGNLQAEMGLGHILMDHHQPYCSMESKKEHRRMSGAERIRRVGGGKGDSPKGAP